MGAYAAFLRGINVGGHQVKGGELCSVFEELGFDEVATFRASGNVVFAAAREPVARMTGRIEEALGESLGYEVPVFLRMAAGVRSIAAAQPFPQEQVEASKGKLQVSMLRKKPPGRAQTEVLELATESDRLAFGDRELFWLPSGGTQESDLDQKAIERLVGVTTMRTKGTVELIAAKYFG